MQQRFMPGDGRRGGCPPAPSRRSWRPRRAARWPPPQGRTTPPHSPSTPAPPPPPSVPVRRPGAGLARLRLALAPRLADLPAPAESLAVEIEAFGPPAHDQRALVEDPGELRRTRLGEAVRHVRRAAGDHALMRVLEV